MATKESRKASEEEILASLKTMSKDELRQELKRAEDLLEDVLYERKVTMGGAGEMDVARLGPDGGADCQRNKAVADSLKRQYDRDEARYRARVEAIKSLLGN